MHWDRRLIEARSVYATLSVFSYFMLLLLTIASGVFMCAWINAAQLFLVNELWGKVITHVLVTCTAMDFFCFVCLVFAAVINQSVRFKPSPFVCYVVITWACMATAVLIECEPSTWTSKMNQAGRRFIEDETSLTPAFQESTGCHLEDPRNCWDQIRFFVDTKFIQFAQCFVVCYPVILGTAAVYVMSA